MPRTLPASSTRQTSLTSPTSSNVADSDESNYGLHRQLGVKLPRDFTEFFGGKEKAFKTMMAGEILDTVKLSAFGVY